MAILVFYGTVGLFAQPDKGFGGIRCQINHRNSGIVVTSILDKMRVKVDAFNVEVIAEQTEEHPKVYSQIKLLYKFKGKDLPMDKLQKAVDLSQERYCGVSAMLRKASELTFEIIVEE